MSDEKERAAEKVAEALAKVKAELEAREQKTKEYAAENGVVFNSPDSLLQRGLESLMRTMRKHGGSEDDLTNFERNGAQARAACDLGWIDGLKADAVDTMHPRVVTWIASQVNDIIVAAWELPGE